MQLPAKVSLCEVGPRDGFQYEDTPIPTDLKLEIIQALANAGLERIQAVSFVHPKWVPQMADAEEICRKLPLSSSEVVYSGLVLNLKGLERALDTDLRQVDISIATNEKHSRDNANLSLDDALQQAVKMVGMARRTNISVQVGFQTVFGYREPGDTPVERVVDLTRRFADLQVESLSYADTTGLANPYLIRKRLEVIQAAAAGIPVVLHLHDTRGLGLANILAALECGITRFDASFGGMGGCPFIPGATGNVATEDLVYMLESMGIETGVELDGIAACSRKMESFLGKQLSGKLYRLVGTGVGSHAE